MATPEIAPKREKRVSPRAIVPLLTREEHALFANTAPSAHLSFHGGALLTAVEVFTDLGQGLAAARTKWFDRTAEPIF